MAEKVNTVISAPLGLNLGASNLNRDPAEFIDLLNVERLATGEYRKRKGRKISAQKIGGSELSKYSRIDPTSGVVRSEVLAAGFYLHALEDRTLTITRTGGSTDWGYQVFLNEGTNTFRFVLTQGGSPVTLSGNPYLDLGTGLEASPVTMEDLRAAIDATANFSASVSQSGVVSTTSSFYGDTLSLNAGHTFTVGNCIEVKDATGSQYFRYIIGTSPTSLSFFAPRGYLSWGDTLTINAGTPAGAGLVPAAALPLTDSFSDTNSPKAINFKCWAARLYPDQNPFFVTADVFGGDSFAQAYNSFFSSPSSGSGINRLEVNLGSFTAEFLPRAVRQYDGRTAYSLGLPPGPEVTSATPSGSGGSLSQGLYKYRFVYVCRDRNGNIQYSTPFDDTEVTTSSGTASIAFSLRTNTYRGFNRRAAQVDGNQTGVTTIDVVSGESTILPGDTIYLKSSGAFTTRTVSAVDYISTPNTITVNAAVTVTNLDFISVDSRIAVYRTKVNGSLFFLVEEIPDNYINGTYSYTDTKADASLTESFFLEEEEFAADRYYALPPPTEGPLEIHQGLLCVGGSNKYANSVFKSSFRGPWYFSPAFSEVRLGFSGTQAVTGLLSVDNDNLFVFKPTSTYSIVGDLVSDLYSVLPKSVDTLGCSSPRSIVAANFVKDVDTVTSGLFYMLVNESGVVTVAGAELTKLLSDKVLSLFKPKNRTVSTLLRIEDSVSFNDSTRERLFIFVPCYDDPSVKRANENSLLLVYDYNANQWFNWGFADNAMWPIYGGVNCEGDLFTLGRGANGTFLFKDHENVSSNLTLDYADNHLPITMRAKPQWDFGSSSSQDKEWIWAKISSLNSELFSPFSLTIKTYRNWDTSTTDTEVTKTISELGEQEFKLASNKATSLLLEFSNATIHQCPVITAFEWLKAVAYRVENLKR